METFLGTLFIIFVLLFVLGPVISRWLSPLLQRWMMGKMEDRVRRMAGMPTRKEERKARKKKGASRGRKAADPWESYRTGGQPRRRSSVEIMQSYAEDVEYVEIKNYSDDSETLTETVKTTRTTTVVESQVEDAEFEEKPNN